MSSENHLSKGSSKKSISRRDMLKISSVAAAGAVLAACTNTKSTPAVTKAPVAAGGKPATVRFWSWYTDQQDQFPKVIADFEAKNPNIKVDLEIKADVTGAYLPALLAAAAADDLPEIYAPHVYSVEFGKKGLGADLIKELGSDFMADFYPSTCKMFVDGNAQYAVGWMAQTMGIYYNSELFQQAGINGEPESWDDMITASNQIKSKISGNLGICEIAVDGFSVCDTWLPMITGFSNDTDTLRQLDFHEIKWTDKAVVDSLTLYRKTLDENLWQKGATGMDDNACMNALYTGVAAGVYSGSWEPVGIYKSASPDFIKKLKVMKTPTVTAGGRHWTGNSAGAAFSVANHSPNKDAALTFLKYLYSPEVYAWTMNQSFSMASTKTAAAQATDPLIKTMASWLPDGCRHWLVGPAGQVIADAIMDFTAGKTTDPAAVAQIMEDGAAKQKYS
jgi:ABC-type glycerol-3-phosphate transport system substrate-binding protein